MEITLTFPPEIQDQLNRIEKLLEAKLPSSGFNKKESDILFMSDAAKKLHWLSKSTIYKKVSSGEIPSKKFGKNRVFSEAELNDWISSNMNDPAAKAVNQLQKSARRHE